MSFEAFRPVIVACALIACHGPRISPPPAAPRLTRPLDAMPADLDLVLRLDLRRIRSTLGVSTLSALSEQAVRGLQGADRATDALLLSALAASDTLWLGLRPSRDLRAFDSVFVMSGHFADFDPHRIASTPSFELPLDLGGNLRRYDRVRAPTRSAPARIYLLGDSLVVSVSTAEIDSVERSFEQQRGAPPLEPVEKGVLSTVARTRALPELLFGQSDTLRRVLQRANRLELNADLTGAGVDATLALLFEDSPLAEQIGEALIEMQEALQHSSGRLAKFMARLKITSVGKYVSLALAVDRDELSDLVNCRGAACAW